MKVGKFLKAYAIAIRNVLLGANLISFSLLKNPRELVSYATKSLFFFKALNMRRGLPEKNVFQVLPTNNEETITLGSLPFGTWFHSDSAYAADIINLCLICCLLKPTTVFEIGTLHGYTAYHFALNTPNDSIIYTLDLPKEFSSGTKLKTTLIDEYHIKAHQNCQDYDFANTHISGKVKCLFGDSANFNFLPFHGKVDFFFIDGAHSYEYVRSDTLHALQCCHPGSVIAWHDFGRSGVNGVSKWLLELSKEHEIFVVPGSALAFMVVK